MYEGPEVADTPDGRLYRLDAERRVTEMERGLTISNGIGWSPDARTMYVTDTLPGIIYAYDYDAEAGEIENRRVLIQVPEGEGFPDGLTVDSQGCIWSARWGGGKVAKYSPSGELLDELSLPVPHPTSCAFGGEELNQLYITSAWMALDEAQRAHYPLAGDVFRADVGVKGLLAHAFRG
jgi:sugar lactone lactonase YvrE